MNKANIDYLKLKLKYLEWERGRMFHSDTIECSEYFKEYEYDIVHKFRDQVINSLNREIRKAKKQLTLAKSCDTIVNTIRNKEENQYENV